MSRQAITHTIRPHTAVLSYDNVSSVVSNIFTDKYNDFIDANRMENASERLKTMKKLVCFD